MYEYISLPIWGERNGWWDERGSEECSTHGGIKKQRHDLMR